MASQIQTSQNELDKCTERFSSRLTDKHHTIEPEYRWKIGAHLVLISITHLFEPKEETKYISLDWSYSTLKM